MCKSLSFIEPLESRIAPAAVFTFTDVDGDFVTISVSKGTHDDLVNAVHFDASGHVLQELDLNTPNFAVANVSITAKLGPRGDGLVNVGYINAMQVDLGAVTVDGDLGKIDSGDHDFQTTGLRSLTVQSLGAFGTGTGAPDPNSEIEGPVGTLTVKGNVYGFFGAGDNGRIGTVKVGGSLIGGSTSLSGVIAGLSLGTVKIGQDIRGGTGLESGFLFANGSDLGSVTVGGSVIGGDDLLAGGIHATGNIGTVKIGHDLRGGTASLAGSIKSGGKIGSITLGGSLLGGHGDDAGSIEATKSIGVIQIGGDLRGGSITGTDASIDKSGYIEADHLTTVVIRGSIITGTDGSTMGSLDHNASIRAVHDIGSVTVLGSIIGHATTGTGPSVATIFAGGQEHPGRTTDLAIGRLTVGGNVEIADIKAGFDLNEVGFNSDAQIGAVKVGGDWIRSNLVAGVVNMSITTSKFGDDNDVRIDGGNVHLFSRIASIVIGGAVQGTAGGMDHYGFVSEAIGSVKVGGSAIKLFRLDNRNIAATGDVSFHTLGTVT